VSPFAPSQAGQQIPIGLAAYSFGYLCGFAGAGTPRACPTPLDAHGLIDLASTHGLDGVEFPLALLWGGAGDATVRRVRDAAASPGRFVVVDGGVVDEDDLRTLLRVAVALGAKTVRAIISTILCGDRRAVRGSWDAYIAGTVRRLRAVAGLASDYGVSIALENHQDVTSDELVALLAEVGSPWVGATLDTANPLAIGEDPLRFAQRILPYLKHVHLKDYHLYRTPRGYRLVRCAVGSGVVDIAGLLALFARRAPAATVAIEMGALEARHIRLLEDDYWACYAPRPIADALPVLRLREERSRPDGEDWRTPWERDEDGESLAAFEREQFERSVAYLRATDASFSRALGHHEGLRA